MERGVFKYILRYSRPQQILLLTLSVLSFPVYYASLQLPKMIVDDGIGAEDFPRTFLGTEFEHIPFLLFLCGIFLALVFFNGAFKYVINVFKGSSGERLLRRLRYQLISRVLRFPLPQFRKVSQGELVSMITAETEPLGGFFGEGLATPVYQGGMLVTLMTFMFVQDWKLGLAAVALYPFQAWLIPKLQRQVNALGKERVRTVRQLSERIGEAVSGASEIHANDTAQYELADFSSRLGRIYAIRFEIYLKKFFIKFLNNFLAQLTPFFFYSIGGILVINGQITIGALIAILSAYKDVLAPWKILLNYYQQKEDARIKYEQIIERFEPTGLLDEKMQEEEPDDLPRFEGRLVASNVGWSEDDGLKVLDGASLAIDLPKHVALTGPAGGGKGEFSQLLARLLVPSSGRITIGDSNLIELPESVTGRRIAYVGQSPYMFNASIRDNLLYGLKHRVLQEPEYDADARKEREKEILESQRSGNSVYDPSAIWVDVGSAGTEDDEALAHRINEVLRTVGLRRDVYQMGLRRTIDPVERRALAKRVLEARAKLRERLLDPELAQFVETFDPEKYNSNASVAENILFGTPVGDQLAIEKLGENSYMLRVLDEVGLAQAFLEKGLRLAEIMVDLFRGLSPDHEFFERFSFISSDDLPDFQAIVQRAAQSGLDSLPEDERARLRALPFLLIPARHHLDIIDEPFQRQLLDARRAFHASLPKELASAVEFFDVEKYNSASSIQDNILFGKLARERAGSAEKVGVLLAEAVDEVGLRQDILELGLDVNVGIGGSRLSALQRQKLAIARGLMKCPDIFILNEALSGLDPDNQSLLLESVLREQEGRSVVYVNGPTASTDHFDQVISIAGGRVVDHGVGAAPPLEEAPAVPAEEVAGGGFGGEIDVLASLPLFRGIDRSRLKLLAFASQRHIYDPGQYVIRQGEVGENAYIVIDGEAEILLDTGDELKKLATLKRNDLFGELALLCEAPRTASIVASTPLTVMSISKDVFIKLVAEDVEMSARVTRSIADSLVRTTEDLSEAARVHDSTTDLPDARLFNDRLRYAVARGRRFQEAAAIITFNLERFFDADSGYSEADRDALLKVIAVRIRDAIRETDMAARLDDLEFGVLLSPVDGSLSHQDMAQRIADSLSAPIDLPERSVRLTEACAFKFLQLDGRDAEDQLRSCRKGEGKVIQVSGRGQAPEPRPKGQNGAGADRRST